LQVVTVVPLPGPRLYKEALKEKFYPREYERFVMGEPILKSPASPEDVGKIYSQISGIFI